MATSVESDAPARSGHAAAVTLAASVGGTVLDILQKPLDDALRMRGLVPVDELTRLPPDPCRRVTNESAVG